ncbi:hypothetical protein C7S18_03785 [Ahniella affigens]|uniref:Uncharacterized protein n=1 Tax=Ahniella affigens TaxID=2021234 RepID=A0A2P1PND3_9GAMM|nr:glycosyltransferase family 4 protein [Ahniella affigens]AVP96364.1 hypothetical protein C7S18_03785 [Ahniella affigens]
MSVRVLILASKCPWPPLDGGRLALWQTIQSLHQAGAIMHLLAPLHPAEQAQRSAWIDAMQPMLGADLVPSTPKPWLLAALQALVTSRATSLARHAHPALAHALPGLIKRFRPDVIHVECLQSMAMLGPPPWPVPVVLRLQNVESQLWADWPAPAWLRPLLRAEARRLRLAERRLLKQTACNLAITPVDAAQLQALAAPGSEHRIHTWTVPFPAELPADNTESPSLQIVLPGSRGWGPNQQAFDWAVRELAPCLKQRAPELRLTVFAPNGHADWPSNVHVQPVPSDSAKLFPQDAIAALPLFAGSGIRMRILESWARGLPVVATSVAARGLSVRHGEHLLLADNAADFAAAIDRLVREPTLAASLIAAGRDYLRTHHDPTALGQALLQHYRAAQTGGTP